MKLLFVYVNDEQILVLVQSNTSYKVHVLAQSP